MGAGTIVDHERRRGRGAVSNTTGRFEALMREDVDDGWESAGSLDAFQTTVQNETARSIITTNDSPDISFDQSINPYRGCEHGCVYCYARPSHTYLGHSAGLDFETKLYAKTNAAAILEATLAHPSYVPRTIALGSNTDPYQPIERDRKITRSLLEVLARAKHPVAIITKSALVARDIDLLAPMAAQGLVRVAVSVTTLSAKTARAMEPRAATPTRRIATLKALSQAGIPTTVMVAPIVPGLTDCEIESILGAAREAGATRAGYVLLRLPLELKEVFRAWLGEAFPDRAHRVVSLLQSMHGGRDYIATFGHRQKGSGPYAEQIAQRFRLSLRRLGYEPRGQELASHLFQRPVLPGMQYLLL